MYVCMMESYPFPAQLPPILPMIKKAAAHGGRIYYIVGFFLLWNNISYIHTISYTGGGGSTDTILNFLLLETFSLIYLYKEIALRHFSQKSRCVQDHELIIKKKKKGKKKNTRGWNTFLHSLLYNYPSLLLSDLDFCPAPRGDGWGKRGGHAAFGPWGLSTYCIISMIRPSA